MGEELNNAFLEIIDNPDTIQDKTFSMTERFTFLLYDRNSKYHENHQAHCQLRSAWHPGFHPLELHCGNIPEEQSCKVSTSGASPMKLIRCYRRQKNGDGH
jgi:hypothetical protein